MCIDLLYMIRHMLQVTAANAAVPLQLPALQLQIVDYIIAA
jgi:hypothetical protein